MSYTLSTTNMVADLQRRFPMGISATLAMDRLNEAYRWICQRGPMNWLLTQATVTTATDTQEVCFPMPQDWESGKPSYLLGDSSIGFGVEIPYKPYDVAIRHRTYQGTVGAGNYAVWTYRHFTANPVAVSLGAVGGAMDASALYGYVVVNYVGSLRSSVSAPSYITTTGTILQTNLVVPVGPPGTTARWVYRTEGGGTAYKLQQVIANNTTTAATDALADGALTTALEPAPTIPYLGVLFPLAAGGTHSLKFIYHQTPGLPLSVSATNYFPSPDVFDTFIVELAESEIRRIYALAGWEIIRKRVEEQVLALVDSYHTTKATMAGLADQARRLQEVQTMKAE